jgi:hypothetical protein
MSHRKNEVSALHAPREKKHEVKNEGYAQFIAPGAWVCMILLVVFGVSGGVIHSITGYLLLTAVFFVFFFLLDVLIGQVKHASPPQLHGEEAHHVISQDGEKTR